MEYESDSVRATSLTALVRSIARGSIEGLRRNKLAAGLSTLAIVATSVLAVNSQYDERPRYRQVILPDIAQAESQFFKTLHAAEASDNENWRVYHFINAHRQARAILDLLNKRWPRTRQGIRAHAQLIRYYELVAEDFAIIRTQMSLDEKMDYMAAWRKAQAERWPVHEQWAQWLSPPPHSLN